MCKKELSASEIIEARDLFDVIADYIDEHPEKLSYRTTANRDVVDKAIERLSHQLSFLKFKKCWGRFDSVEGKYTWIIKWKYKMKV